MGCVAARVGGYRTAVDRRGDNADNLSMGLICTGLTSVASNILWTTEVVKGDN